MADRHSSETRSYNMSRIKGKDTQPEMLVRRFLHSKGFRYTLHDTKLPGKPDIVLPKYKTIIFVNGCFWHGHENCKYYKIPKTRTEWWTAKISRNVSNDVVVNQKLKGFGWSIIYIWTCDLKSPRIKSTLAGISDYLKQSFNRQVG